MEVGISTQCFKVYEARQSVRRSANESLSLIQVYAVATIVTQEAALSTYDTLCDFYGHSPDPAFSPVRQPMSGCDA